MEGGRKVRSLILFNDDKSLCFSPSNAWEPAKAFILTFLYAHPKIRAVPATRKQTNIPIIVGTAKEIAVHFKLFVSFPMVIQVVEHGQCIKENSIVHIAVSQVQPLLTNSVCSCVRSLISVRLPVAI